ncbi:MAG: CHAT domain-containing protein [Pseudomonadota bacterium]
MRLFLPLSLSLAILFGAAHAQRFDCDELEANLEGALLNGFGANYYEERVALEELLTEYDRDADTQCPDLPSRSRILMHRALSESNVREFAAANQLFDRAEVALDESEQDDRERDEVFLTIFRVLHDLNQRSELRAIIETTRLDEAADQLARTSARGEGGGSEVVAYVSSLPSYIRASLLYTAGCSLIDDNDERCASRFDAADEISTAIGQIDQGTFASLERTVLPRYRVLEAQIFLARDDFQSAEESINEAIRGWRGTNLGRTPLSARAYFLKGRIEIEWGLADGRNSLIERGLDSYRQGIAILEQSPGAMDFDIVWPFLKAAYDLAQEDPARQDALYAEMFRAIQIIRSTEASRSIAAAVTDYTVGLRENSGANRRYRAWQGAEEEVQNLRAELAFIERTFGQDSDQARIQNREIVEARREADRRRRAFERRDNDNLAERLQQPVAPREIIDQLASDPSGDAAYLVTASGESNTGFVFLIDGEGMRVHEFENPVRDSRQGRLPELKRDINELRRATRIEDPRYVNRFKVWIAHEIYQRLYGPLAENGRALPNYPAVYTTSIGPMEELPLAMLITEDPEVRRGSPSYRAIIERDDYTGFAWLGNDIAFTYLPAIPNFVALSRAGERETETRALLAGGFVREADYAERLRATVGDRPGCDRFVEAVTDLDELPDTEDHLAEVSDIVGNATVRSGAAFSNALLREMSRTKELESYGVIHLYTHGFLPPKNTCVADPFIVTTADAPNGDVQEIPGFLTAPEIAKLDMNAQLVFVSACNSAGAQVDTFGSAGNQDARAESLSGLARSFLQAGARSIVVAHWTVYEQETRELVQSFYRYARDGDTTIAGALRDAAGDVRSTPLTSHPIYWAGFVAVGAGGQVLELGTSGDEVSTAALPNDQGQIIQ